MQVFETLILYVKRQMEQPLCHLLDVVLSVVRTVKKSPN